MASIPSSYTSDAAVAAVNASASASNDYRALVCVFLFGGNDSHNMVVPLQGNNRTVYDAARGANAVAVGSALAMTSDWGLHPNLAAMKTRFDAGDLAVLLNVGPLSYPTNRFSYMSGAVELPDQLYSHNTQQQNWQATNGDIPASFTSGWMGRAGELVGGAFNPLSLNGISPAFSIAGRVLQTDGHETIASVLQSGGPVQFNAGDGRSVGAFAAALTAARTRQEWNNLMQRTFAERVQRAVANQAALSSAFAALPTAADTPFSSLTSNSLAMQLKAVARLINARSTIAHRRDLFFVSMGGFDNHDNLVSQYSTLMTNLNNALNAFWLSLVELGMQNNVTTFTESDFGRTLVINTTSGSDHGWGGHHLIMGGAVNGGVYGTADLTTNGEMDAGQGRLIPTTSTEQYISTLLEWWGVPSSQMSLVLPKVDRFTPKSLPMLSEPASVAPAPALALKLTAGPLDPRIRYERSGPGTYFDAAGKLRIPNCNLVPNSAASGAVEGVVGSGGALPSTWWRDSATGINTEVVKTGILSTGEKYVDIRIFGTNGTGAALYPKLHFGRNVAGSIAPARYGSRLFCTFKAQVIAGSSTTGFSNGSFRIATTIYNSGYSYLADGTIRTGVSEATVNTTWKRVTAVHDLGNSSTAFVTLGLALIVSTGATIDVTVRIAEPQLSYAQMRAVYAEPVPEYIETTGLPFYGPRFDHDPVTLKPRGLMAEKGALNVVQNSAFSAIDPAVHIGTPGTLPSTMSAAPSSGLTGLTHSLVRVGQEDGLPFIDIRVQGVAAGTSGAWNFDPVAAASIVSATASSTWTHSVYMALKDGALPNTTNNYISVIARNGTTFVSDSGGSVGQFNTLANRPLREQRFQATYNIGAGANGLNCRISVAVNVGDVVDFTLRLGGMQLEESGYATSWVPTYGYTGTRGNETIDMSGTNFTDWFVAGPGALVVKAAHPVPSNVAQVTVFPAAVSDGSSNNRVGVAITSNTKSVVGTLWSGGSQQFSQTGLTQTVEPGQAIGLGISFDTNSVIAAARGAISDEDTSAALPVSPNRLVIGGPAVASEASAWIQSLAYYNTKLTANQMSVLTSG